MSWRALNDEAPYRKVSKQSEGLEGFLRGDTVKVEASQDPGAKKRGVRSHRRTAPSLFFLFGEQDLMRTNKKACFALLIIMRKARPLGPPKYYSEVGLLTSA